MDDDIARLRDELSRLDGPARLPKLAELGSMLNKRYWTAGPGQPASLPHLSAAIEVWDEAYRLLDPGDPARGQMAAQLGTYLAVRHGAHGGAVKDRDTGIFVLDEALKFPSVPPAQIAMARIYLGQLYLGRATEAMSPAAARGGFLHGAPTGAGDDADRAARLFREVLAGPAISEDIAAMTRTLLTMAEALGPLLGGNPAGLDIGKLMESMAVLQRLQQQGMPTMNWTVGDPLTYPTTVMDAPVHQPPTVPPRRSSPVPAPRSESDPPPRLQPDSPAPRSEPGSARQAAHDRLASLVPDPRRPVWDQARDLLLAGPSAVAPGDLDAFVGAAANAAAGGGVDRLLLAIGLSLREQRDGNGWGDADDSAFDDARAELRAAMADVPPDHPAAVVVVEAVGGVLDGERPLAGAITEISSYAEKISSLTPAAADLAALCRREPFQVTVPAAHPWHAMLTTAASHCQLLADVRRKPALAWEKLAREGRARDAFTAFEISMPDPAALDAVAAVTGVTPSSQPETPAPTPDEVAAAVRKLGAAALLYAHPSGTLLRLDAATARLDVPDSVPAEKLLVAGLLPHPSASEISYVSSGAQTIRLATREVASGDPLFVVNPRGDRDPAMPEIMAIRRLFYPQSLCAGRALEPVDVPGTAEDVLKHLPTAGLTHLACGVNGTEAELADGSLLDLATLHAEGGVLILGEGPADPSLLDAGFTGVVGWLRPVPPPVAALALFMLHLHLVEDRLAPVAAVAAVRRWMKDPDRPLSPLLTGAHLHTVRTTDLTRPDLWSAPAYCGR
ncbi:hypothetical protein [Paractinoplanes atraurantiacus]|uniref:CHAT domain-containing protein n=1 Tax=Paractinoplanes atraurantiacus TaxID=1036182 RepID=A0A285HFK7_9ACTN|nr:hypothetical protein [Actinoplanes atraurantiacus]SNY34532.1 hypothetical protein SAMN05421748_104296 [Actinoplanes atraurantiacus]